MVIDVSKIVTPQTYIKFQIYERLLREWNDKMSLVQKDTLDYFMTRHVLDSLQIIPVISDIYLQHSVPFSSLEECQVIPLPIKDGALLDNHDDINKAISIVDVGTGAGFPGMVLALCGYKNVTLCDSNYKKCMFLEEIARQTQTDVKVINDRAEFIDHEYQVVVSRATMDLKYLLGEMKGLSLGSSTIGIFHKGKSWKDEVLEACIYWDFSVDIYQSVTSFDGVILAVKNLSKK